MAATWCSTFDFVDPGRTKPSTDTRRRKSGKTEKKAQNAIIDAIRVERSSWNFLKVATVTAAVMTSPMAAYLR